MAGEVIAELTYLAVIVEKFTNTMIGMSTYMKVNKSVDT